MNYNKNVADIFFKAGFIEAWGRGILLMTEELKNAEMPEPVIEEYAGGFQMTFLKGSKQSSGKSSGKSSEKSSEKVIGLILSNPKISASEMANSLSITQRAVEKIISKLKKEQKIKRIGPAKGGHWQVVDK